MSNGPDFSQEEIAQQAALNAWAVFSSIDQYLRERGQSPAEFTAWMGRQLASGWEDVRGDLARIAYYVALNPVSLGAELHGYDVEGDEAMVKVAMPSLAEELPMPEPAARISEVFSSIMDYLDVDFAWEQEGDLVTYRLRQRS